MFLNKFSLLGDDEHKRPTRMQPLNSESILTKEQLFDMFQQILGVKKFEHQILFNALMVRRNTRIWENDMSFCFLSLTQLMNKQPPFDGNLTVECNELPRWSAIES